MWKRLDRLDGTTEVDRNWFKNYGAKELLNEVQYWEKINLTDLQEYDILVFTSRKGSPIHFGMYIETNQFIHVEEDRNCSISLLDDEYREKLYGAFRK